MVDIVIEAEGRQAEPALARAAAFFEREFGVKATPRVIAAEEAAQRGLGPEWLAVILCIPSAIVAVMDLSARLRLIERTTAMLGELRAALGAAGGVIRIGARASFDIATAKAREIVDALTKAEKDEGGGGEG
jgi:hypothetical protein